MIAVRSGEAQNPFGIRLPESGKLKYQSSTRKFSEKVFQGQINSYAKFGDGKVISFEFRTPF